MASYTTNLNLLKKDPVADASDTFNITTMLNENWDKIDAAMGAARAAEPYSAAKTYAVGDYCTKDGALFKCTVAITAAEAWTAAHWKATSVAAEILAIIASLSNKADTGYLISPDLNDVRASGIYRFNTPENGPDFSYGHLLVMSFNHGNGDTCFQLACDIARDKISFRRGNALDGASPTWTNWTDIATATPPTEYDLPLAGVTGTLKCSKSQDSKVLIPSICVTAAASLSAGATIATLPASYYPSAEKKALADIGGTLGRVIISTAGVITISKAAASGAEICTGSIAFVAAV